MDILTENGIPTDEWRARYLDAIRRFCLMDDTFMTKVFEDKECAELLLRIILDKELTVIKSVSQYNIKNLQGRSIRLDIYAVDSENRRYNIEVQREDSGAVPKRARYNSSLIDANTCKMGDDYSALPETYVIFIMENDVFKRGLPLYTIDRTIKECGYIPFGDESHIVVYVNGSIRDETTLGRLMQDFFCTEAGRMNYATLAKRVGYLKNDTKGVGTMCKIMDELFADVSAEIMEKGIEKGREEGMEKGREEGIEKDREEGMQKGREEGMQKGRAETQRITVLNMLAMGKFTLEEIAQVTAMSVDEVKALQQAG